jgi:hypothetical protein
MEPLEFSYTVTGEDHARAIRAFTLRQPMYLALIGGFGLLTVMMLCLFLGIIVLSLMGDELATDPASFACVVPCFVTYLLIPAYLLILGPYLAGQKFKKYQDRVGQVTWVIDDNRVKIDSSQMKSETDWQVFSKAMETKGYYFLIYTMNKRVFQFVPKRAFESPQQEADFRRYVEKNIGPIK